MNVLQSAPLAARAFSCLCVAAAPVLLGIPVKAQKDKGVEAVTSPSATRVFHGTSFDLRYPANFPPSAASQTSPSVTGSDEVTFTSSDKRVQFYVFSPQWNGSPSFVVVRPGEKVVSQTSESRKNVNYAAKVKWITVEAKNKSYTRTWEDLETTLNTRRVVGIKYKTEADFKKYRSQYLAFKKSLEPFGD